jgi:hypothetical protein
MGHGYRSGWATVSRRLLCLCFKCELFVFRAALHFVACFIAMCKGRIVVRYITVWGYDVIAVVLGHAAALIFDQ